jgi:hypothetical protein
MQHSLACLQMLHSLCMMHDAMRTHQSRHSCACLCAGDRVINLQEQWAAAAVWAEHTEVGDEWQQLDGTQGLQAERIAAAAAAGSAHGAAGAGAHGEWGLQRAGCSKE